MYNSAVIEPGIVRHDSREDLLIAVDFQNVYLPGHPWACAEMEQALDNTLRILRLPNAPDHVFTKFIASDDPVGCWARYNKKYSVINADQYLSEFPDAIKAFVSDGNVVEKCTYSSMDCEGVRARLGGKKRVVLTGVVAECCVLATMLDAIDLGYEVIYLYDCISGCTPTNEQAVKVLAATFSPIHTHVITGKEYIDSITEGV